MTYTCLIVENDSDWIEAIRDALPDDVVSEEVQDAQEALGLIRDNSYDFITLDLGLSGPSGKNA